MIPSEQDIWFIHPNYDPPLPLCYRRQGHSASIVGGKTGSHHTGHTENYWDKFTEVLRLGFVPVDIAKDLGIIPAKWTPPDPRTLDNQIKQGHFKLITR